MSRKNLKSAKSSKVRIDKKQLDIYDQLRPHSGIKYYLSQTEVNWSAGVQSVHLKQTAVEYEPGQDLTTPPFEQDESVARYTKRKHRGPVWRFQEEIEEEKREERAERMKRIVRRRQRAAASKTASSQKDKLHAHIVHSIGPEWYHELSNKQMHSADNLKDALMKDHANKTVANTQDILTDLGLAVWPHHTKIAYVLKKYYLCPVEFLLKLYKLNRSKKEIAEHCYTLDNRLLLSAVVHLTMRNTLRELHLRIPSPPKVKKGKHKEEAKKKLPHHPSPYLNPFPFIPQPDPESISKSRRKEYPKSRYFNYVKDMYEMYYEVQSESSIQKQRKRKHQSKYDKPPKIPVRQLARKLIGEKKYRLKKPSVYMNPCDKFEDKPRKVSISKEEQTSIKPGPHEEEQIDTEQRPQGNEQQIDDEAIQDDKVEEITDECTCKPVGEHTIEKETAEDRYYLCTCGQADKEAEERRGQKQSYQRNKQFIFNLNMFNIENNTFYYPCICQHGQTECCMLNKVADNVGENKETEEDWNKKQNDDAEPNAKTENMEQSEDKQNTDASDGKKNTDASDGKKDTDASDGKKNTDASDGKKDTDASDGKKNTDASDGKKNTDASDGKKNTDASDGKNKKRPEGSKKEDNMDKKLKFNKQTAENETPQKDATKENKDQKKNTEKRVVEKENRRIRKSMANIQVNNAILTDTAESSDKIKVDEEESKEEAEEEEDSKRKPEKCRCMKMYDRYMDKHEHCLELFEDYKTKIEQDMLEYMKDIEENRCTCGDSGGVNHENDTRSDDDIEETVEGCTCGNAYRKHRRMEGNGMDGDTCGKSRRKQSKKEDVNGEEIVEGCTCSNKHGRSAKDDRAMNDASNFMGCTCGSACKCGIGYDTGRNVGRNAYYECTCGNHEDRQTTMQGLKRCTCRTKDHSRKYKTNEDTLVLSTIPEEIDGSNNAQEQDSANLQTDKNQQKMPGTVSHSENLSEKSSRKLQTKEEESQEETQEPSEDIKEVDARIFVLEKFPRKKKQQMILLKKALAALAQDGYPLAKLPECHRLPHFQVWLDKRSGKYLSMAERAKLLEESRMLWNHTDICKRHVSLPELGIHPSLARKMTWAGAYKYKQMITDTMYNFTRILKQAYVSETQEFFPTTLHHKMPNKTFRDCYFAYLPSDEHQIYVNRPWQLHEHRDATKDERCN